MYADYRLGHECIGPGGRWINFREGEVDTQQKFGPAP